MRQQLWLAIACALACVTHVHAMPQAAMALPGGVEGLARALRIEAVPDRSRVMVDVIRRLYNQSLEESVPEDRRAIESYFAELRRTPGGGSAVTREEVPLPLGVAMWRRAVLGDRIGDDEIAPAILLQRRAACFYHALASLDDATLAYLDTHPEFVASLFERHAEVLTTFGRSVRIRDGRVVVPGGAAAEPLWEAIVERKVSSPEAFIDELLGRDAGRFAFLYDALAHVPEPVRRLVLNDSAAAPTRLRALARVFANVSPQWHVVDAPMWRPAVDPAMWLNELRVSDVDAGAGADQLAAGFTRRVWEEIFRSDDVTGAARAAERIAEHATEHGSDDSRPVDIAWLAERVFLDDQTQQRTRYEMTLWAQRVFASADVSAAIAACRGYARFSVLLLTLERMDLRDPAVYADAVTHAIGIISLSGVREQTSLALYQAALAIVERLRLSRRIDVDTATTLVRTLAQLPLDETEPSAAARWIDDRLVPAIAPAPAPEIEPLLLQALGGRSASGSSSKTSAAPAGSTNGHAMPASAATVQWEGQAYRVDVAAAERARILAVRRAQQGVSLDAAMDALRPRASGSGKAGKGSGNKKAARQALAVLADALVSMAYAAHLPADRPELLRNAPWARHDFGLRARAENLRRKLAWVLAEELTGGGIAWHLRGSLLALDLVLAPYQLRRISDDPPVPTINEGDRVTATVGVMLLNPFDATDDDRDRLAATLARGRAAIADRAQTPDALLALAQRAGFSEWRLHALRWTLARADAAAAAPSAAAAAAAFAVIDQFWAGEPDAATIARLDRWGTSIIPITGQFATRLPRARAWEEFTGRASAGVFVTQIADVHLQTAAFLAAHTLPAALYRGAMAAAVQEFVDRAQVQHFDDWSGFVTYARSLPPSRFEDYVATLTVDGPLRTLSEDGEEDHP